MSEAKIPVRHVEGLVVYTTPPQPVTVPYPEPIKVSDPIELRRARIETLLNILRAHMALAQTLFMAIGKAVLREQWDRSGQSRWIRELLEANYTRELQRMDETWKEVKTEIAVLVAAREVM